MAHIPDGVLSSPVLIAGALTAVGLLAVSLRRLDYDELPRAAVLSAAFFVSSSISVPLGPSSVHLLLNGLMGLLLGWTAVPAQAVGLTLQLAFFGHGGLTSLGVNLCNMAIPALLCSAVLRSPLASAGRRATFWIGALAGGLGVLGTGLLLLLVLELSDPAYGTAARVLALTYVPLAAVEGLVSGTVLAFLRRVDPDSLRGPEAHRA